MMSEESNITMPPEERIEVDHLNKRMEKKMATSATNELGKHPSKKIITELLENQQRKEQACSVLMENISKLWSEILPLAETIDWIDINKETRNLFHQEDKWRTWVIYKHHK